MLDASDFGEDTNSPVDMDPPEHARLRRIAQGVLTPRAAEACRPQITEVADRLLGDILDAGPFVDLRFGFASLPPVEAIYRLLGVPPKDGSLLCEWSDLLLPRTGTSMGAVPGVLVAHHRRVPGGPRAGPPGASARHYLTDDLIAARDEDAERLGDGELANTVGGLIIAGMRRPPTVSPVARSRPARRAGRAAGGVRAGRRRRRGDPAGGGLWGRALLRVARQKVRVPSGRSFPRCGASSPRSWPRHDPLRFPEPEAFGPEAPTRRVRTTAI